MQDALNALLEVEGLNKKSWSGVVGYVNFQSLTYSDHNSQLKQ